MLNEKIYRFIIPLFLTSLLFLLSVPSAKAEDFCETDFPKISDEVAVYLYNYESNRVLLCQKSESKIAPASTAKIMTGVLACEIYSDKLYEKITITSEMLEGHTGTSMNLKPGMTVTVRDLLYGTICGGNNDAAQVLAIACAGSINKFVDEMNFYARRLYMNNTHYTNPTGLDNEKAYTTISDTAKLARKAAENEIYMAASSAQYFEFVPEGGISTTVYNRNALMSQFSAEGYINKNAKGIISGNTDNGGYVLATLAERNGVNYLCVVMGASADQHEIRSYSIVNSLLNYVFNKYEFKKIANKGDIFASIDVGLSAANGEPCTLNCVLDDDVYIFVSSDIDISADIDILPYLHDNNISAPVNEGKVVGGVDFYHNGILIGSSRLIASETIKPNGVLYALDAAKKVFVSRTFITTLITIPILYAIYILVRKKAEERIKARKIKFY